MTTMNDGPLSIIGRPVAEIHEDLLHIGVITVKGNLVVHGTLRADVLLCTGDVTADSIDVKNHIYVGGTMSAGKVAAGGLVAATGDIIADGNIMAGISIKASTIKAGREIYSGMDIYAKNSIDAAGIYAGISMGTGNIVSRQKPDNIRRGKWTGESARRGSK